MRAREHPSTFLFYSVAAALGVSFSCILLLLAWNNALDNETRKFSFDTISINTSVGANIRTAEALIDNLASFVSSAESVDAERFESYTSGSLASYPFVRGMAYLHFDDARGLRLRHVVGTFDTSALFEAANSEHGTMIIRSALEGSSAATPMVHEQHEQRATHFFLLQSAGAASARGEHGVVALALDMASLLELIAVDPAMAINLYTESEGVAGRRLVYRKMPAAGDQGAVVEALGEDSLMRLDRFSIRLRTAKDLMWSELDKGLLFVALFLGVGVTLLLVALARAKELQARELEARNLVIEEQVRQQTHELAEARDQALEASRVKSDFLASMSHEIRTPLNAIIGMAELLSETRLTGDQEKYVGVFKNSGEALLSLVNDILDLSKIEARQLLLEHIDFNVIDIVEQAIDIYALKADAKDVELVSQVAVDVPVIANGDPGRLRQIILNLIGNAIKFTESGQIVARVTQAGSAQGGYRLHFAVSDSGIGIPADKLGSIFSSFTQVDSSTTRKYGGTGLGLTISKRLVEMMDGRIWVESEESVGSTFQFEIGLNKCQNPVAAAAVDVPMLGAVLIIDDNPSSLDMLQDVVRPMCAATLVARDADSALRQARDASATGHTLDLVLCDADLAGVSGVDVGKHLGEAYPGAHVLMMFRASTLADDIARMGGASTLGYIVKPVKRRPLLDAIIQACATPTELAPATLDESPSVGVAARILLVEDNPDNRLLIKAYLKKQPYEIVEAENGEEAINCYTSQVFDLVLMDVQMPVMDGYTATRAIRSWEREHDRPRTSIIALTANAIKEDMDKSIEAGCDVHLTKPIKKQTLLDALAVRLEPNPQSGAG